LESLLLSGHSSRSSLTKGGGSSELNGSFGVHSHEERGHVHELLAHTDVSLSNQHTSVVDGLGQTGLENKSLKSTVEQSLGGQLQDIIELLLFVTEETISDHSSEKGGAFEESLGIVSFESEELSGSLSDLGEGVLDSPDLSLTSETVLTTESELLVESFLLERSSRGLVSLGEVSMSGALGHSGKRG
jgi:hypothetical protein